MEKKVKLTRLHERKASYMEAIAGLKEKYRRTAAMNGRLTLTQLNSIRREIHGYEGD